MAYTHTTFAQLVTSLATRLSDPNKQFWIEAELENYTKEALRVWQAYSQTYSTRINFPTVANTAYYDLFAQAGLVPSITDRQMILEIEQHLQEPLSATSWIGSEQFTYPGLVQAIQQRRDKFLLETGMVLTISTPVASPSPVGNITLDQNVLAVVRLMWKSVDNIYTILWRSDQFTMTGAIPDWMQAPGLPTDYSTVLQHPLTLQLCPPPNDIGSLHIISINAGPTLNPTTTETILGIPDDFCWVVKLGALADIFGQDGPGQDLARAQYFESRWRDGIQLARISNFVKLGYLNGVPQLVGSLAELDQTNPNWPNTTPGTPDTITICGNIIETSPTPDSSPFSAGFDIAPNFPMPTLPGDYIQVSKDTLNIILDYAQHVAAFKEGITDINENMELYKNLVRFAATTNDKLRAASQNFDVLSDRSARDKHFRPIRRSDQDLKELEYAQTAD